MILLQHTLSGPLYYHASLATPLPSPTMSVPRFYIPPPLPSSNALELPPEAAHHALRVLRLRAHDAVQLFDGAGNAFDAVVREAGGKRVVLDALTACAATPSPPLYIVLAQAMCSSEKMDWVVQKATELGVAEVRPVQAQRSVAKLPAERAAKRAEHWRSVTISACEQCGRNALPQVHAPQELGAWLAQMRDCTDTKLILQPGGNTTLAQQPRPQGRVVLLVGPEGGFSPDETLMAQQAGFTPILLGPNVLRTETAALAGITALQVLWGGFY